MTKRIPVGVFFALFTISGFAGLIYQSIWSHYLKLFLGHAAYAQTLVLAIFMGGMAIGSWLVARLTRNIRNLLLGYAMAEAGIGLLAVAFHPVFRGATAWAFDTVLPALGGGGVDAFKWTLASLLILPPSILLGTTFPLMSGGIIRTDPESGPRALAMLYFTNSLGAAIGVLASGFWLIDRFGLPGTVLTAGMLNIALALVVWAIVRRAPVAPAVATSESARTPAARRLTITVLAVAFGTGAASFVYEVTWIRMLVAGLGASSHAFEVMLAAFILGMALGALWLRNRIGRMRDDTAWLAGVLALKAILAMYAVWVYGDVLGLLAWMLHSVSHTHGGYVLNTLAGLGASMAVMLPAAFCAGMTLPLATNVLTARGAGEAAIGKVYAANTAGCILGAVFATHVGMELLGVKGITASGALVDAGAAAAVYVATRGTARPGRVALAAVVAGLVAVAVFAAAPLDLLRMSSGVYRYGVFFKPETTRLLFYRDGKTASISVVDVAEDTGQSARSIRTNGKPDASITPGPAASMDEATMTLAAALPLAMKPDAQDIANVGFGSGLTTHSLLGSPRARRVDTIEIERMMIEGARLFLPRNSRAYEDPRSYLHIEDAKTYFASAGRRYDIIASEPSNPWVSGVSTLFSEEFYGQLKRYLKPDGVMVQWIQTYEIDLGLLSTVFNALGKQFGDYAVYRTGVDLLIIATPAAKLPDMRPDLFEFPGLRADLAHLGFERVEDLRALRMGDRAVLEPLFASTGYPANSDYFPILDQHAPEARFLQEDLVPKLAALQGSLAPVLPLLAGEQRTPLERLHRASVNNPERIVAGVWGAEAIGVALTGSADHAVQMPAGLRSSALTVHALMDGCRGSADAWMDALTDVAHATVPYIDRADVEPLFAAARKSACARTLDERNARRLALLEAINARDAAMIATHATYLLEHAGEGAQPERGYYLASALAANLALGRIREAVALRDAQLATVPYAERRGLEMQLVLSRLAWVVARTAPAK